MSVLFTYEESSRGIIDEVKTSAWIKSAIKRKGYSAGNLNYIFLSDDELLKINKDHLNHDYYTDVITFDYSEAELISGDIFISVDRVKENAQKFNEPFQRELYRVMVHGVLHLMGLKDKTEEEIKEMRKEEEKELTLYSNLD